MPRPRILLALAALLLTPTCRANAQGPAISRIAFGSCADQEKPQPIWEPILATKPDLFLFIGDNIYADTKDAAVIKKKYDKLAAIPGYQKLLKACPVLATWDDHDYGWNDAGTEYPLKKESQQLFLDFFGVPRESPRRQQEGVYHAETFGPEGQRVQVILLDTRYFRSPLKKRPKAPAGVGPYIPSPDTNATMLGEEQWKWLGEQLKVPAQVRLICSSIQVVPEDHGWEKWMNFPHERERLYKLIKDTKAGGVIFLSGDRHLAELSLMDGAVGYPLYDLTSSGLNQGNKNWRRQEVNRHRVATMNFGNNFGLITIDWAAKEPNLTMQIRDEDGEITIRQKIKLSLLQPGALKAKKAAMARLVGGDYLTDEVVKAHLNKKVTIEMRVLATGGSAARVFLNSAEDFTAQENFTVVLEKEAQEKFAQAGIEAPRPHFQGQVIRVTGVLSLFRERPQMVVTDPSQIEIVKK